MKLWRCSAMKASERQDDAAEAAALAVDVLGRGIDHDVGAELQRALPDRRREHVVDDQPRAGLVRDLGDRRRCRARRASGWSGSRGSRSWCSAASPSATGRGRGRRPASMRCRSAAAGPPPHSGRSRTSPSPPPRGRRPSAARGSRWSPPPCRSRSRARLRRLRARPCGARTSRSLGLEKRE